MERLESIIVGGGQAGLATSYWLSQRGRDNAIGVPAADFALTERTSTIMGFRCRCSSEHR